MNKPIRIILKDDAKESFMNLSKMVGEQTRNGKVNSSEKILLNSIKNKIELIKQNPFHGDNIKKNLIPKKYKVKNLWRTEISNYWRMIYTIRGDEVEVFCFVLDMMNHKKYNKIFGYK
jgi:Txe/YoeB family toxin of Txe-Axe toxin-antitoxin module